MGAISFTGLFLVLLLSSVASRDFIANASQVDQIGTLANADRFPDGGMEHHDDTRTASVAWNKMLRGRKMGAEGAMQREAMKVKGGEKPGANPSVGKCNHQREGDINVACKLSNRGLSSDLVEFITFSSDYRGAKGACKISSGNSCGKSYRSMSNQDTAHMENKRSLLRVRLSNTQELGSQVSHGNLEPETHSLFDAATEISTMLSKDYAQKARSRSPIHNHQPIDHENAEP